MIQETDRPEASYLMYTMDNCPWCVKAKALFDYYQVSYKIKREKCEEWDTYPAIYKVNGESMELIGGFNELSVYSFKNGL